MAALLRVTGKIALILPPVPAPAAHVSPLLAPNLYADCIPLPSAARLLHLSETSDLHEWPLFWVIGGSTAAWGGEVQGRSAHGEVL